MTLSGIIFFILIAMAVGMLMLLAWRRHNYQRGLPDFDRQRSLLTTQQQEFYKVLTKLVGAHSVIMPRVNLSNLVHFPGDNPGYEQHWKRVLREWVDFVICSPTSISPVLAIKLETRGERKRRKLGRFDVLEDTLKSASIPLLRYRIADSYDAVEIMSKIRLALISERRKSDKDLFVTQEFPNPGVDSGPDHAPASKLERGTQRILLAVRGFTRAS